MAKIAILPKYPDRICWGCEKLCPINHLNCRETRVPHPVELFGDDWYAIADNGQNVDKYIQISYN